MNKGSRENVLLLICFVLIMAISLIVVFSARGDDEELEYYPGATVDFNIGEEPIATKKKGFFGLLDLFKQMRTDLTEESKPIGNLVGSCPPENNMYECPIEDQITEGVENFNRGVEESGE